MINPLPSLFIVTFCIVGQAVPATADDGEQQAISQQPVLLQMIRDDSVQQALKLTESQRDEVRSHLTTIDAEWFPALNLLATGNTSQEDYDRIATGLTHRLRQQLQLTLRPGQMHRLQQLECQALGARMVLLPQVRHELSLTDSQMNRFIEIFRQTEAQSGKILSNVRAQDTDVAEAARQVADIQRKERESVVGELTEAQRGRLVGLLGEKFDFARVQRKLPLAPELSESGASWVLGEQRKLADLRGKVVVVHFYAFECINCIRNLPHYSAWYDDYADQGLVVIGIQRPETKAESNVNRVIAAAKKEGIEYPILMDSRSSNWNRWGNRIWPSVYLIDHRGFLRRSWYGEMNWQGSEGEKDMRSTIEALLAESRNDTGAD